MAEWYRAVCRLHVTCSSPRNDQPHGNDNNGDNRPNQSRFVGPFGLGPRGTLGIAAVAGASTWALYSQRAGFQTRSTSGSGDLAGTSGDESDPAGMSSSFATMDDSEGIELPRQASGRLPPAPVQPFPTNLFFRASHPAGAVRAAPAPRPIPRPLGTSSSSRACRCSPIPTRLPRAGKTHTLSATAVTRSGSRTVSVDGPR